MTTRYAIDADIAPTALPAGGPVIPEPSALEFGTLDVLQGPQITRLISPTVGALDLIAHPMWTVRVWDTNLGEVTDFDFIPPTFPTFDDDGERWHWTNAAGDTIYIRYRWDHATGELFLRPGMTFANPAATLSLYSIDLAFAFANLPGEEQFALTGQASEGVAHPNPQDLAVDLRSGMPGAVEDEGGVPRDLGIGYLHLWTEPERVGVMLRTTDQDGRGKIAKLTGASGDGTVLAVKVFREDNRRADGENWECAYEVVLRPMIGEAWDGAFAYQRAMKREGHPAFVRGPQGYSYRAESARVQVGIAATHGAGTDWDLMREEVDRLSQYMGTEDSEELVVWPNGWGANPNAENLPNVFPPDSATFDDAVDDIEALGHTVAPYCLIGPVQPASEPGLTITDESDVAVVIDTAVGPSPHELLNFYRAGARAAARAVWDLILTQVPGARGWYTDTLPGFAARGDHRSDLASADRGEGSDAYAQGWRTYLAEQLAHFRASHPDFLQMGEHTHEALLDLYDVVSTRVFELGDKLRKYVPVNSIAWGRYVRFTTFGSPSAGIGTGATADLFAWYTSLAFHRGIIVEIPQNITVNSDAGEFLVPAPGEPAYTGRWVTEEPLFAWVKRLYFDAWSVVSPYLLGQRLRALPGSYERTVQRNGHGVVNNSPVDTPIHSSAWIAEDGAVGVLLTNWDAAEAAVASVVMHTTDFPMLIGTYQVKRWDSGAQTWAAAGVAVNGLLVSVDVLPRSLVVLKIEGTSRPVGW